MSTSKMGRLRPSPALVIACLALFVAFGGVGMAALKLKPNSVKTKNIKDSAVSEAKIADGAVNESKIADGAVTGRKIAAGSITSGKFFASSVTTQDFGMVNGPSCEARDIAVPGLQASDFVVVTPPLGFPNTFTLEGHPNPAGTGVTLVVCNTFGSGAVDPDGVGGGSYKVLVIR
jgi:hypothetical protein